MLLHGVHSIPQMCYIIKQPEPHINTTVWYFQRRGGGKGMITLPPQNFYFYPPPPPQKKKSLDVLNNRCDNMH